MRRTAIVALVLELTAPTAGASSAPDVRVWVTTPDRAELTHERPRVTFGTAASTHPTIAVDPDRDYQTMDGFGASTTDSSTEVLAAFDPAVRADTMRKLIDPEQGIGVSFLRQPVGSSDFTAAANPYTYDDVPAGQTDFELQHFSIAHDQVKIPPAWMRSNDSLVGGQFKDDPKIYDAYARYLVKFVKAYPAAGVPIDFLSVQNEPQHRKPDAGDRTFEYTELSASDDGTRWRTLTTGSSTGQLTTIDVRRTSACHLRITSTGTASNWWSIADLRLYD